MLACALSPASSSSGSRLTLPDRINVTPSRCACPTLRSQLRNASASRFPSGVMRPVSSFSSRFTSIGNSSIASTTGRPLSARAVKIASPLCGQLPASIPARSFTFKSATDSSSIRPPALLTRLAKPVMIRSHAARTGFT